MEYECTFMEKGSDLRPQSLVISLFGSSGPSKHSSYLMVSAGLVPAFWIISRQQQAVLLLAGRQCWVPQITFVGWDDLPTSSRYL